MEACQFDLEPRSRAHSKPEVLADGFVHIAGILAGLTGAGLLLWLSVQELSLGKMAAIVIYSFGLLAMLIASAAYNIGYATRFRAMLRRCDHSAIFLMIAGTYTPFTTQFYSGEQAVMYTGAVWGLALGGISLKWALPFVFEKLSVFFYLGLGWMSVLILGPLFSMLPNLTVNTLIAGGLLYSSGVIFHLWEKLPFHNAIWHVFVLAAASCHYIAILDGVVLHPMA